MPDQRPSQTSQYRREFFAQFPLVHPPFSDTLTHDQKFERVQEYFSDLLEAHETTKKVFRPQNDAGLQMRTIFAVFYHLYHLHCILQQHLAKDFGLSSRVECTDCGVLSKPINIDWLLIPQEDRVNQRRQQRKNLRARRNVEKKTNAELRATERTRNTDSSPPGLSRKLGHIRDVNSFDRAEQSESMGLPCVYTQRNENLIEPWWFLREQLHILSIQILSAGTSKCRKAICTQTGKLPECSEMSKTLKEPKAPNARAMSPIRAPSGTMQARRAGDSEPKIEEPIATRALRSKRPTLYSEMLQQKVTLHKTYNSLMCMSTSCKHCRAFYDHIDAKRRKKQLNPAADHEAQAAAPAPALEMGKSTIDVAFTLQKIRGYLDATNTMDDLVGVAAATELSTLKRKLLEAETAKRQLEGQLKAARRQLNALPPSTSDKRPAVEDIDPRPNKRLPGSNGAAVAVPPVSAADLADPETVWRRLHNMPKPGPRDDYLLLAQWLQHREVEDFKGIPLKGPDFTVDLRDPRGYQQVFSRVPYHRHGNDPRPKEHRQRCVLALLRILTVPKLYESLVRQHHIPIHPIPQLEPCDFPESAHEVERLTNSEIATLLAKRGLAVADADDLWQFCHHYVRAHIGAVGPNDFQDADLVGILLSEDAAMKSFGTPLGIRKQELDVYPRSVPGFRRPSKGKLKKIGGKRN
ncbi:hypothetical protein B0H16DRAFT_1458469 [Mycena metata]|uniref:Uncharacterized protein n=1 Tax=Mycena metata TaxID=1033252 RepID=A0AAD7J4I4_9AGAR|nr:hypothetical protein B0H16DRAFT_1458469 [Mycena metata]